MFGDGFNPRRQPANVRSSAAQKGVKSLMPAISGAAEGASQATALVGPLNLDPKIATGAKVAGGLYGFAKGFLKANENQQDKSKFRQDAANVRTKSGPSSFR
jgi:hypothetical protein